MVDEPTPPDSIPTYVQEGIDRQDRETLREIAAYAEERAEYLAVRDETPPSPNEIASRDSVAAVESADSDEYTEQVREFEREKAAAGQRVSVVRQTRNCGRNCSGCPHGPYYYAYWRENGQQQSKYLGPVPDA